MPRVAVFVVVAALAGCHSAIRYQDTRVGETRRERRAGPGRALTPTVRITDAGRLRFVTPLACGYDTVTDLAGFEVERIRPNAATVIVGVISAAVGVVALASGLATDDPGASPLSYLGAAGFAVGVPLVIGPLTGNETTRNPTGVQALRRAGGEEPCGELGVAAQSATIGWDGLRAAGAVDADGTFAISPFDFIDAFDVGRLPALVFAVELARVDGPLHLETVVDASELARARAGFFAARGIDATIVPIAEMRKVPELEPGRLTVALAPGPVLRLALPLDNIGPGDAYGVRLVVASSSPEIDGRVVYLGRVAAHGHARFETTIPLSIEAERAIAAGATTFSALVLDAHQVAPTTPVRFRGAVLRTGG